MSTAAKELANPVEFLDSALRWTIEDILNGAAMPARDKANKYTAMGVLMLAAQQRREDGAIMVVGLSVLAPPDAFDLALSIIAETLQSEKPNEH